MRQKYQILS